jgi:hypothetical protein
MAWFSLMGVALMLGSGLNVAESAQALPGLSGAAPSAPVALPVPGALQPHLLPPAVPTPCAARTITLMVDDRTLPGILDCLNDEQVAFLASAASTATYLRGSTPATVCAMVFWLQSQDLQWYGAPCTPATATPGHAPASAVCGGAMLNATRSALCPGSSASAGLLLCQAKELASCLQKVMDAVSGLVCTPIILSSQSANLAKIPDACAELAFLFAYVSQLVQNPCGSGGCLQPCPDPDQVGYVIDGTDGCVPTTVYCPGASNGNCIENCPSGQSGAIVDGVNGCVDKKDLAQALVKAVGNLENQVCRSIPTGARDCMPCSETGGQCLTACPNGSTGEVVDGYRACVRTGPCPDGTVGQMVDGEYLCVSQDPCGGACIESCPPGYSGYIVDGVDLCARFQPCSGAPHGQCLESCPPDQVGEVVAGTSLCTAPPQPPTDCASIAADLPVVVTRTGAVPLGQPPINGLPVQGVSFAQYQDCIVVEDTAEEYKVTRDRTSCYDENRAWINSPVECTAIPVSTDMAIPFVSAFATIPQRASAPASGSTTTPNVRISVFAGAEGNGNRAKNGCNLNSVSPMVSHLEASFSLLIDFACYAGHDVGFYPTCCSDGDNLELLELAINALTDSRFYENHPVFGTDPTKPKHFDANREIAVVFGWIGNGDYNGLAATAGNADGSLGGGHAIGAEHGGYYEWANTEIFLHEVSHLYSAVHDGTACTAGYGIMNWCFAARGVDNWDQKNYNCIAYLTHRVAYPGCAGDNDDWWD